MTTPSESHVQSKEFDFIGRMLPVTLVSGLATVASIVLLATLGLNFGIDFAGGYEIQVKLPAAADEAKLRSVVEPIAGGAQVQSFGEPGDHEYRILVRKHGSVPEEVRSKLLQTFTDLAGGPEQLLEWTMAESGESFKVGFAKPVAEEQVREVLTRYALPVTKVSTRERTDQPVFEVTLSSLADQINASLHKELSIPAEVEVIERVEFVGPQVGEQLRNQGIWAVMAALFFLLLYVGFRFDLFFAPGAIVATLHDVTIVLGVFAVTRMEFDLTTVAAVLTVVGYSINDTIVIYDRVRENVVRLRGRELRAMVNTSLNETLSRTLVTGVTTLSVIVVLLMFAGGAASVKSFSITLFIGIVVGTYSSIAVASPVYIVLRERYGKATGAEKSAKSAANSAAV